MKWTHEINVELLGKTLEFISKYSIVNYVMSSIILCHSHVNVFLK